MKQKRERDRENRSFREIRRQIWDTPKWEWMNEMGGRGVYAKKSRILVEMEVRWEWQ